MKILFATTNQAKIKKYQKALEEKGIELISINDLDFKLEINENGKDVIENAYIKAKTYYEATKMTTIGMDNCLWIEGLPEEKQPGTHVRRVNGKELTDEEMICYYADLVKQYGGKLTAKWVFGIVIYDGKEAKKYSFSKSNFYLVDQPCQKRNPGYPLDSISIMPESGKYWLELTEEEKKENKKKDKKDKAIEFILNSIQSKK